MRSARETVARVALQTGDSGVFAGKRELRHRVVLEHRSLPLGRGMARLAGCRESSRFMIRICCRVVDGQVASRTLLGCSRVLAVAVALGATGRRMFPGKREARLGVIELSALPLRSGVAGLAGRGEPCIAVVRIGGGVIGVAVTGSAVLRSAGELVVDVALLAAHSGVLAGERVFRGRIVIEAGAGPLRGGVAGLAGCGEPRSHVIGVHRILKPRQVASGAILHRAGELIVDVALLAGHGVVLAGESEARAGVIEHRAFPLRRRVAHGAGGGESGRFVIGIDSGVIGRQMATGALVGDAGELVVDVALGACRSCVLSGEGELSFGVVEGGSLPAGRGVTGFALCGKRRRGMVWILRRLELFEVAGGAILREVLEYVSGMALHATGGGVLSGERELGIHGVIELRAAPLDTAVA